MNLHAIIMPNEICNLACSYCYVLNKTTDRMTLMLAKRVVDEVLVHNDSDKPTRFIWHGGEPMLAGLDFYRNVCAHIAERHPTARVEHYIQTNGTLLKGDWISFFIEQRFRVGVSLDGWRELHDMCRKTVGGQGTFDVILDNVIQARRMGLVAGFLSVLTRHTVGRETELFDFFRQYRFDFGFHPITSLTPEMDQTLAISPDEFAAASICLFDLAVRQEQPKFTDATPAMHYLTSILLGCSSGLCVTEQTCAEGYISVEPTGRVHVCDRFAGNADLCLGNIADTSLQEILDSPIRREFLRRWEITRHECNGCDWIQVCHGGCPHEAYVRYGNIFAKDPNCSAYRAIWSHVAEFVAAELSKAEAMDSEQSALLDRT